MAAGARPEGAADAPPRDPRTGPLDASAVRGLFRAASAWLDRAATAIDAINVYPVPDGDTGSNMAATLREALVALDGGSGGAGEVAGAVAQAALRTARGNSGVILSQLLHGVATATAGAETLDGTALASALESGSQAAYGAVREPVEGTILTVARVAAEAALGTCSSDPLTVFEAALTAARDALERTPDLLPVLKEAGVVDSGGFGLVVLLEGATQYLRGEPVPRQHYPVSRPRPDWLADSDRAVLAASFGYCTEFVIAGGSFDVADLRRRLEGLGDSVIVAGRGEAVHAHLHTADPGAALSLGTDAGSLTHVKVENISIQCERFVAAAAALAAETAVVAVIAGDGLAQLARDLGVMNLVPGGTTMNPSVAEILEAIESAPAAAVIVLPNHKNVVSAAEQAAGMSKKHVLVLKTTSAVQGISAAMTFREDASPEENLAAMSEAIGAVRTVEVTFAARGSRLDGIAVLEGQPIALVDGQLSAANETLAGALDAGLAQLKIPAGAAVTVYYGEGVEPDDAARLRDRLSRAFKDVDVQVVHGGQPHYPYIVGVE